MTIEPNSVCLGDSLDFITRADLTEGWLTDHSVSVNCNANDREGGHQDCHTGEHLYFCFSVQPEFETVNGL